jgi:hypothetical protein
MSDTHRPFILELGKERRAFLFLLIAILYAVFSSSTPEAMGIAEISIGLLLVLFVGLGVSIDIFGWGFLLRKDKSVIPDYVYVSFLALAAIPTVNGLFVIGNSLSNFMRDFIPFLYLYIPIFFLPHMAKKPSFWLRVLLVGLSAIGISYSIRFFFVSTIPISLLGKVHIAGDLSYYPMEPAVLFSSTFLITSGIYMIFQKSAFATAKGAALLALGVVVYSCLVAVVVRAQIILVLFSAFAVVLYFVVKKPVRGIPTFAVITFVVYYFHGDIVYDFSQGVFQLVMDKFRAVGLSGKESEIIAVMKNAGRSSGKALFGEGWGGLIEIYEGVRWRWIHNFFAYLVFKAGLIGLIFGLMYVFWYFKQFIAIARKIRKEPLYLTLIVSIINIFIVHVILEPGFKMFSFGLILMVITLASLEIKDKEHGKRNIGHNPDPR